MNLFLVLVIYIIILIAIKNYINDYISKFILITFSSYWCISLGVSTFSPFGLFQVHTSSYLLLLTGVLSFVFGMCSVRHKKKLANIDLSYIHNVLCKMISSKWLIIIYIVSILYLFKYAMNAIAVAALQGFADTSDQYNLIFQGNSMAQMVYGYILMPLFHMSLILMSYYFLNFKKVGIKYLPQILIYVANLLVFIAIGGGRSTVVIVGLYLLITYVFLTPREKLFKLSIKKFFYIVGVTALIVYAVSLVSNYRDTGSFVVEEDSDNKGQGLELLARYSLLPYVLFDYGIQHDYLDKFGYQFGKATFLGFDNWIYIPMKVMGIHYETCDNIVKYLDNTWIPYDRSGTTANYAYTGILYHYLDFGIIGVVFFPFLFGYLFRKIILSTYKKPVFSSLLLLSMCFFLTMHSVFSCYLIKGWTGLYLAILFFVRILEKGKMTSAKLRIQGQTNKNQGK